MRESFPGNRPLVTSVERRPSDIALNVGALRWDPKRLILSLCVRWQGAS